MIQLRTQSATPQLSVPPLVESHTLSATQELENALHALQERPTHLALKFKTHAMKNVSNNHFQNATTKLENAIIALTTQLNQDVS